MIERDFIFKRKDLKNVSDVKGYYLELLIDKEECQEKLEKIHDHLIWKLRWVSGCLDSRIFEENIEEMWYPQQQRCWSCDDIRTCRNIELMGKFKKKYKSSYRYIYRLQYYYSDLWYENISDSDDEINF